MPAGYAQDTPQSSAPHQSVSPLTQQPQGVMPPLAGAGAPALLRENKDCRAKPGFTGDFPGATGTPTASAHTPQAFLRLKPPDSGLLTPCQRQPITWVRPYSTLSARASQLASMMLVLAPTVLQR
ncbi:MAG: hypothetical protein KatS3mg051_0751 [Anaerolineae bacterium]|nr:MAG: hypothetical protein KatS3mg051_0751 [Anaerolineae bacterium]